MVLDSKNCAARRVRAGQSGFAYLMALFIIVVMIIGSTVAMSNLATQGKRERETETIWRGGQWVRAIRLFYRKTGRYPQTLDDLENAVPSDHFLRFGAYKDSMNSDDGSWRFIYVNAAGQIIGSVKYATLQQMALMDMNNGQMPAQSNALGVASGMGMGAGPGTQAQNPQNPGQQGQMIGPLGQPLGTGQAQTTDPFAQLKPTGPVDSPVIGGLLSGVGSKVDKPSIRVYNGGAKYNQWEFIWNPLEDQARALQQGLNNQGQPGAPSQPAGSGNPPPPVNPGGSSPQQ